MLLKMAQQSLTLIVFGLLLFLPAGTLAWPQGWALLVLFSACGGAVGLWLMKTDPDLLAERMKPPLGGDQKPRDRAVMGSLVLGMAGWQVFMALDARRFGWPHVPPWAQALGAALIVGAFMG